MSKRPAPTKIGWTAERVAAELGYSVWTFYRKRAELETKHGFPKAMSGTTRYDPKAIAAWQARDRGEIAPAAETNWEEELVKRATGGVMPPAHGRRAKVA